MTSFQRLTLSYKLYHLIGNFKMLLSDNKLVGAEDWVYSSSIGEFQTNAFGDIEFLNEDEGSNEPAK